MIDSSQNMYTLNIPIQSDVNRRYTDFYLFVFYQNPIFKKLNSCIYINNDTINNSIVYSLNNINGIDTINDVGLSIYGGYMCDSTIENTAVYVNGNYLGGIGGNDYNSISTCAGVVGSFSFYNSVLFGIGDDNANILVVGSDGLSNIRSIDSISDHINLLFFATSTLAPINYTNSVWGCILAYTTPCDTFTAGISKEALLCKGDSTQLTAFGGVKYKWKPNIGLSCDTCANLFAKPDSSILYTCTIYNNDSCTKVLPVKVNIHKTIVFDSILSPATCALNDGSIGIVNVQNNIGPYVYNINGQSQSTAVFNNLFAGNYFIGITDSVGCTDSVWVVLPEQINVFAGFNASANTGTVPIDISFTSTTTGATNYLWNFGDGTTSTATSPTHTYTLGDTLIVLLIAWANDSSCADTAYSTIILQPGFVITQGISDNNDGKNDTWIIQGINNYPNSDVVIFNRWGNLVYEASHYQNTWNGTFNGELLPVGTYFYVVYINVKANTEAKDIKSGYLELAR